MPTDGTHSRLTYLSASYGHPSRAVRDSGLEAVSRFTTGLTVPPQPFLPVASIAFATLTPSSSVDSALYRYDNFVIDATTVSAVKAP